jgi:hypothetical protein
MDLTKEQEVAVMTAVESVIESSDDLEFFNDYQYDLVCEAVEVGIKSVDPVFDADGNVTTEARKAGLAAGILIGAKFTYPYTS